MMWKGKASMTETETSEIDVTGKVDVSDWGWPPHDAAPISAVDQEITGLGERQPGMAAETQPEVDVHAGDGAGTENAVCAETQAAACLPSAFELGPVTMHDGPSAPMLYHELATLFPELLGDAFGELVEDVRLNGVANPVVLFEGKILDGRNRYLAARESGRPYPTREFLGSDALGYVISQNLKRRHLDTTQRANIAAKLANHGPGRPPKTPPIGGVPIAQAATMLNVGERSVERAVAVRTHGAPELVASVDAGDVSLGAAAEIAKLPESIQAYIVNDGPQTVAAIAAELREAHVPAGTPAEQAAHREEIATAAFHRSRGGGQRRVREVRTARSPPMLDALAAIVDNCVRIAKALDDDHRGSMLDSLSSDENRDDHIDACRAGRAALTTFLEAWDERVAAHVMRAPETERMVQWW
jgi:hypothetical protein